MNVTVSVCDPAGSLVPAGGLYTNVPGAFAVTGVTWLLSLSMMRMLPPIPPHPDATRPSLGSVAEGLRFARAKKIILATFVIDLDAMIFGMPSSLFPQLALTVFNAGASGYGLLQAAPGI